MKSLTKKKNLKKQPFQHFAKLSSQQMISLRGGTDEIPPEDEQPKKV